MSRRRLDAGVIALLVAGSALLSGAACAAQEAMPFVGRWRWAGAESCAKDFAGETVAMEITKGRRLLFLENTCRTASMRKLGANSYRFRLICTGEGDAERRDTMLVLLAKSDIHEELLLRIEVETGFVVAYRKCDRM